jgi:DNA-binding transcriptional ArsR family regulator
MLVTLMDGRALTACELAEAAGVAPQTASGHLARLVEGGLFSLERQGRHRYFRLSSPAVASMLEGMMALDSALASAAAAPRKTIVTGPRDRALRRARLCYDHLAGEVAVAIADGMTARGELDFAQDGGALTERGAALLASLDVTVPGGARSNSLRGATFCRPCLDWSERRPHVAGAVGAALYRTFTQRGWVHPVAATRAVSITPFGMAELKRHFGLTLVLSGVA